LSSFNILNKPSIIPIDDKEYVMKPGIGLLAECEYELKDSKENTIKLNQYALPNDQFKILINDETINEKYETSNSGKYNMNLVDSSIVEVDTLIDGIEGDNDIESASLKQISKKIISKRNQNESNDYGKFNEYEIEMLDRYSNFILKEELNNNGQGVLHLTDSNESIVKSNDIKEYIEINNSIKDVKNQKNGCMGNNSNNKCLKTIKIDETHDVEGSLSKLLRIAKKDDQSNTIKLKENEKVDLSKPENLCEDSETIEGVLRNILKITRMSNKELAVYLFHFLMGLLERYKNDSCLDHESIRDLNEDSFKDLTTLFSEAVNLHDRGNSEEKMSKVTKMIDSKSTVGSQSKYVNDKFHEIYDNIFDILNDYNMDISNMGFIDNMDINNKRFNDDRTFELDYLVKELNELRISGNENTRKDYKEKLLKIYNNLSEIEEIFDRENSNKETFVNNSQIVYTLKETMISVLSNNEYLQDNDVQARIKTHRSTIGDGIKKSTVKSTNVLNLDHIIGKVNMDDYILQNSKSMMYVKKYFDGLKDELYDEDEDTREKMIKKVNNIQKEINEKIEKFNSYRKPDGHYEEANHLVELINNYNELIATALSLDIDIGDEINYIYIENDVELSERLNHIRVKGFNKVLESIKENSPESFKINQNKKISEHLKGRNAQGYGFGGVTEYEGRFEDFKTILKDNIDSEFDAIVLFTDKDQLLNYYLI